MHFKGHLAGGVVTGAAMAVLATVAVEDAADMSGGLGWLGPRAVVAAACFAIALLMALFPDLDTASLPQRWVLRGMFLAMIGAFLAEAWPLFAVLAFAALLPALHRHRGWTHWRITPWLVAGFLATAYEYHRASASWFGRFDWEGVAELLGRHWVFVAACVAGHYTHLLLDARSVRGLPFIRNGPRHH